MARPSHDLSVVAVTALMILDGDDSCEEKEWELTQEEKEFFHK